MFRLVPVNLSFELLAHRLIFYSSFGHETLIDEVYLGVSFLISLGKNFDIKKFTA